MAQINVRVPDADKATAEAVVKAAGFTLTEYLLTIISYMAEHETLPVVIKLKPVAYKPDECFQQAITKFRQLHFRIKSFMDERVVVGKMSPLSELNELRKHILDAEQFYSLHEKTIAMAQGQLEKIMISEDEHVMFARCREHFPNLSKILSRTVGGMCFNNRAVMSCDLEQIQIDLDEAAHHINTLQGMIECEISLDTRKIFFLEGVQGALFFAKLATRVGEGYIVCVAYQERMNGHIRQAEAEFERLGILPDLKDLEDIYNKLQELGKSVDSYLEYTSEPMRGFNVKIIDELEIALQAKIIKVAGTQKQVH